MAKKRLPDNWLEIWLDKKWSSWEANYEENEVKIQILFGFASAVFITISGLLATQTGGTEMTPFYVVGMGVSFWITVICVLLIIRNAPKSGINRKLDKMSILLEAMAKKQGIDVDAVMKEHEQEQEKDKNGDNKPKQ